MEKSNIENIINVGQRSYQSVYLQPRDDFKGHPSFSHNNKFFLELHPYKLSASLILMLVVLSLYFQCRRPNTFLERFFSFVLFFWGRIIIRNPFYLVSRRLQARKIISFGSKNIRYYWPSTLPIFLFLLLSTLSNGRRSWTVNKTTRYKSRLILDNEFQILTTCATHVEINVCIYTN